MIAVQNRFARLAAALLTAALAVSCATSTATAVEPATVDSAAKVLDLQTFPRLKEANAGAFRSLGLLMYQAPASATAAFDFQRKELTKRGWKELPGGYHDPGNHSGQFSKEGFVLTVGASAVTGEPEKKGWSEVSLVNQGNVPADKLPVPKGVKPFGFLYGEASYLTDTKVPEAAKACEKLLLDAGWVPYGAAGDEESPMMYFKKNAIRLMAWVSTAPAQDNKTMIRYTTELLSADLPAPPEVADPRYNDRDKSLRFDYPGEDTTPLVKFYQEALSKLGWKATTDTPITDDEDRTEFMIFRNQQGDLISLDMGHFTDIVRVDLEFETAAEVKENERLAKEAAEKKLAEKKAAELAEKEQPEEPAGVEMPELPDTDDVGALLKAAEKMAKDAIGEATEEVRKATAPKKKPAPPAAGAAKVADIPMPAGAGVEYSKITKMIKVKSADDIGTLAKFFMDSLGELGWETAQNPLITDDTAIIKLERGSATLTIMGDGEDDGSEATLMTKGLVWDAVPANRAAAKTAKKAKPREVAEDDSPDAPAEMPAEVADSDADEPKPVKLRYAAKISAADQKQTGATIRAGGKDFKLAYGVAYQAPDDDKTKTEVLLSTKPINVEKLIALLNNGQDGGDALGFDPQLKLRYDDTGKLSYLFLYADGLSVNLSGQGEDTIQAEIAINGDRAKGKAVLVMPGKLFDNEYTFTAPFDVKLIVGKAAGSEPGTPQPTTDELGAEDYDGLPVPLVTTNRSSIGSPFRKSVEATVPAALPAVVDFYRRELTKGGWKEDSQAAKVTDEGATLAFTSSEGTIGVTLARQDDKTQATLTARYPAKAKAAGIDPQAGKGRLILGNAGEKEISVVINGQPYKVAAGKGAENPKDGVSLHVLPGNYNLTIKVPGQPDKSEKMKIAIGETWGVITSPTGGYFADQVY
jgi:hypothetical protein